MRLEPYTAAQAKYRSGPDIDAIIVAVAGIVSLEVVALEDVTPGNIEQRVLRKQELHSRRQTHVEIIKAIVVVGAVGQEVALVAPVETDISPHGWTHAITKSGVHGPQQHIREVESHILDRPIDEREGKADVHLEILVGPPQKRHAGNRKWKFAHR